MSILAVSNEELREAKACVSVGEYYQALAIVFGAAAIVAIPLVGLAVDAIF